MNAEILCIGTELLLGNIVNTNAAYLSQQLARLGINVYHHTTVGDNPQRLAEALNIAFDRSDLVVTTGGLGPTYDDLSKETVAAYFKRQLVFHEPSMENLQQFYQNRPIKLTEDVILKQAYQPEHAVIFHNHSGTAPGAAIEQDGKIAILLPGPPREMKLMFEREVEPFLQQKTGTTIVSRDVRLFGIGESNAEALLRDLMVSSLNPTLAPYAKEGEVSLRLTASAPSVEKGYQMIAPMLEQVEALLGTYIYGIDVPDLQTALVNFLLQHQLTVSSAESCTGGQISKAITDVPGCSAVFLGGACTYSNQMKMDLLGVSPETLSKHGAVSPETALEMAQGIRKFTGSQLSVATTGVAGPGGGTEGKPVGLVYIAIASAQHQQVEKLLISYGAVTSRAMIQERSTKHALYLLLQAANQLIEQ